MRSDWDPEHGQKPDLQRRYSKPITTEEWRYLQSLVIDKRQHLIRHGTDISVRLADDLIAKIEARITTKGERT